MKYYNYLFLLLFLWVNSICASTEGVQFALAKGDGFPVAILSGNTYTLPIQFTNTGSLPLTIQDMKLLTAPFGLTLAENDCLNKEIMPQQSCTFNAAYATTQTGTSPLQIQLVSFGYVWKKTNEPFYITVSSGTENAVISSTQNSITLEPNQTTHWTIHNDSSDATANQVSLVIPSALRPYIATTSSCSTIAPESTCDISLTTTTNLPTTLMGVINAKGDNTNEIPVNYVVEGSAAITVSPVVFNQPGTQNLMVSNGGSNIIGITGVNIGSGLHAVTLGSIPSDCLNLAPNTSCQIPLSANVLSYGSDQATVNFHSISNSTVGSMSAGVSVANATLLINDGQNIIPSSSASSNVFSIKNTGAFEWIHPQISFTGGNAWVTILDTTCTSDLAPGKTCHETYQLVQPAPATIEVTAMGDNVTSTEATILTNILSITPAAAQDKHLQYALINITNSSINSEVLKSINAPNSITLNNGNQAVLCTSMDSMCPVEYRSTCGDNMSLSASGSCKLWYRVIAGNDLASLASADQTISVTVAADTHHSDLTFNQSLHFASDTALYVGGDFSSVGGGLLPAYSIAKWDGSTWASLNNERLAQSVKTLTLFKGDLYAGGSFSGLGGPAAQNIAKWDGSTWNPVNGGTSGQVYALAANDNYLYVGGKFALAGTSTANNVAKWDGTTWAALSSGVIGGSSAQVSALAVDNNILYVGGGFTSAGGITMKNIAKWDGTTWSALGSAVGANGSVSTLALDNHHQLYIGGFFDNIGGLSANSIAKWTGAAWVRLATGVNGILNNIVIDSANNLYVGGSFFTNQGSSYCVGQWTGGAWSVLGAGPDIDVYQMISFNNTVYVGGSFSKVGTQPAANLAKMVNGTFQSMSTVFGVDNSVNALLVAPSLTISSDN